MKSRFMRNTGTTETAADDDDNTVIKCYVIVGLIVTGFNCEYNFLLLS
jgi:hypothetical protein